MIFSIRTQNFEFDKQKRKQNNNKSQIKPLTTNRKKNTIFKKVFFALRKISHMSNANVDC